VNDKSGALRAPRRGVPYPVSRFRSCLVLALVAGAALWPVRARSVIELRDDRGAIVRLAAPATKIVALAPSLTELTYAAGAGERLIGVARFSDYPAAARQVMEVGDASRVDVERIVALEPQLVLAWKSGNQAGDIAKLSRLGHDVFVTEPVRLADIARLLRAIGTLAGTDAAAERAARTFEQGVRSLRQRYAGARKVRALYEVWPRPFITVSGRHMISDVIALCGGENVFADARGLTPSISLEAVVAARPDVIVGGARAGSAAEFKREWRRSPVAVLRSLPTFYVDPDLIQRQTPRILEGAKIICTALDSVRGDAAADGRR